MKNTPDLLQVAEEENSEADLTADAGKINEDNDNMNISYKEHQKTVEYE